MSGPTDVGAFYDDLAATYDRIYADWDASMTRQADALDRLIRGALGAGPLLCLDCACGIGTQLIGLAARGYTMSGTDLSAAAAARAAEECRKRGLTADIRRADMRRLPFAAGTFDVVVCADNSLPHLLIEDDVLAALTEMSRVAREGALVVVTTRDYDAVVAERPDSTAVQRFHGDGSRWLTTQLWDWHADEPVYDMTHLQIQENAPGRWTTTSRTTTYRAWTRAELAALAARAGLGDITWSPPQATGYFQPVMTARRSRPRTQTGYA